MMTISSIQISYSPELVVDLMTTESHILRFEDYPEEVEAMLTAHNWEEPLNRQRMGVILTFSTAVPYHGGSHRFYVDELSTGHEVYYSIRASSTTGSTIRFE